MKTANKIDHKTIEESFEKHSSKLLPIFFEMQSTFLSGVYKRYGDLEGGHIVISFARDLHLEILRKRENDLAFNLSLENFWNNHKNIDQRSKKIINIHNSLCVLIARFGKMKF